MISQGTERRGPLDKIDPPVLHPGIESRRTGCRYDGRPTYKTHYEIRERKYNSGMQVAGYPIGKKPENETEEGIMRYLATTFSPAMLGPGRKATVGPVDLDVVRTRLEDGDLTSAVGHEVTASVLSGLLGARVEFARVNLVLKRGDVLYCVIPNFRADVAREFTRAEVESAGVKSWRVEVD